jgi:acyl-CoA synthetase (AMP-forming)/AMP-acid ligase II
VEAVLRAAGGLALADVAVVGVPSSEWGKEVVAVICGDAGVEPSLRNFLAKSLTPAKRPKRYVWVSAAVWPRDARGKLSRVKLAELAARTA